MIGENDRTQIGNVVRLLDSANKDQGLRYFLDTNCIADLTWTREVVTQLLQAVKPHIEKVENDNPSNTGEATKFMFVWGKPVPQSTK